ncbi:Acyltransferase family protein [gamma proteobacterium HdN1]|nr:Acyltransferase family protein [gamma proteobacterium HdN1]
MFGYEHKPFSFQPLTKAQSRRMVAPLRFYFSPEFDGIDKLDPAKPVLIVGNHTLYGVLDVPLLIDEIYQKTGISVRTLADHTHYEIPVWRTLLDRIGAVEGTRSNCARLMEQRDHIMVFPGGAREVAKRKGEKYQLVWKRRFGFVHMAIKYGYPIVPFAAVGPDDVADVVWDANDLMNSSVGKWLGKIGLFDKDSFLRGGDIIFPMARGIGITGFPRPEKFYFAVGDAIETAVYQGQENDADTLEKVRAEVAHAIDRLISEQMIKRSVKNNAGPIRRLLTRL